VHQNVWWYNITFGYENIRDFKHRYVLDFFLDLLKDVHQICLSSSTVQIVLPVIENDQADKRLGVIDSTQDR
jgi:hypothetical protein